MNYIIMYLLVRSNNDNKHENFDDDDDNNNCNNTSEVDGSSLKIINNKNVIFNIATVCFEDNLVIVVRVKAKCKRSFSVMSFIPNTSKLSIDDVRVRIQKNQKIPTVRYEKNSPYSRADAEITIFFSLLFFLCSTLACLKFISYEFN